MLGLINVRVSCTPLPVLDNCINQNGFFVCVCEMNFSLGFLLYLVLFALILVLKSV